MKNIENNNKLIAEFMGFTEDSKDLYLIDDYNLRSEDEYQATYVSEMKFRTSWDWLMVVVEEIDHHQYEAIDSIEYAIATRSLKNTYQAVVEYIKQNNKS
mgnify:CR=1 FL=1